ncbi:MAG: hypothetical protein AAFQ80_17500 [Cyanobacteria bacterium J06621_8]
MSLWQQIQETIINTTHSTKAIAVDTVETFQHHQALALNKKADRIRQTDSHIETSEAAADYFKQKARLASHARQQTAANRLSDENRFERGNKLVSLYDAVTSDLETLKEAGSVLWGCLKTADNLARATVEDTQKDIRVGLESTDARLLKEVAESTVRDIVEPVQQVWQQGTDTLRSLDLDRKGQEMLDYFQDLGKDR